MRSFWILVLLPTSLAAQVNIQVVVDAATITGTINPLWGDHYDMQLLRGSGGNPSVVGPHALYIDDAAFQPEMIRLQPRSLRVSSGRYDDPGSAEEYSTDTMVLRDLRSEFYRGPNTLAGADDTANYHFGYVDSLVDVVLSTGAEPFMDLAAMPITLSSVDTPTYFPCVYWNPPCHLFSWDNAIRTAPPADPAVYGRVFYHLVKHLHDTQGVRWFEVWNEPDQFPGLTPFWDGDVPQLHAMLSALTAEVNADPDLSPNVEIGCCGFAMNSFLNLFMHQFLSYVQQNSTRLDFLSLHPYSASELGGYDSTRTTQADALRDLFVPGTPMVNSEWGILNPGFGSAGWNSLDYGIDRVRGLIEMNDRDYLFAHAASMADNDTSASTCCLGMFYTRPTFAPKPSAFAYMAMNKLNGTPQRLACSANAPHLAMAGLSVDGDTVRIALPAPDPAPNTGQVSLTVADLPWNDGTATRYELTMTGYAANTVLTPVMNTTFSNGAFTDSLLYVSDNDNGRLIIWELVRNTLNSLEEQDADAIIITPDAGDGVLTIRLPGADIPEAVRVLDMHGRMVVEYTQRSSFSLGHLPGGMYLVDVVLSNGERMTHRWVRR